MSDLHKDGTIESVHVYDEDGNDVLNGGLAQLIESLKTKRVWWKPWTWRRKKLDGNWTTFASVWEVYDEGDYVGNLDSDVMMGARDNTPLPEYDYAWTDNSAGEEE